MILKRHVHITTCCRYAITTVASGIVGNGLMRAAPGPTGNVTENVLKIVAVKVASADAVQANVERLA